MVDKWHSRVWFSCCCCCPSVRVSGKVKSRSALSQSLNENIVDIETAILAPRRSSPRISDQPSDDSHWHQGGVKITDLGQFTAVPNIQREQEIGNTIGFGMQKESRLRVQVQYSLQISPQ